ncbi:hypothetical protein BRO54_0141 [Geobacillus proteiniphilus]|uniref:Uncharacterized protein n=1 Tax=Geobacillus proteiniphilus TaxID=860353 RepID=A0A1Q5TAD2_9BACL|nr:hypothetical protein BRO54_0141 [Geobacillus proteiniphilus]
MPSTVEKWTNGFSVKDMLNFFIAIYMQMGKKKTGLLAP